MKKREETDKVKKELVESSCKALVGSLKVERHEDDALFFREAWADGEVDGEKVELTRTVGGAAVIVCIGKPARSYSISVKSLIECVHDLDKKELK